MAKSEAIPHQQRLTVRSEVADGLVNILQMVFLRSLPVEMYDSEVNAHLEGRICALETGCIAAKIVTSSISPEGKSSVFRIPGKVDLVQWTS